MTNMEIDLALAEMTGWKRFGRKWIRPDGMHVVKIASFHTSSNWAHSAASDIVGTYAVTRLPNKRYLAQPYGTRTYYKAHEEDTPAMALCSMILEFKKVQEIHLGDK